MPTFASEIEEARRALDTPPSEWDDQAIVQLRYVLDRIIAALELLGATQRG